MKRRESNPVSLLSNPFKLLRETKKGKQAGKLGKVTFALQKESKLGPLLHKEATSALLHMESADPSLKQILQRSYGYAIFPRVGKASALLGGAFGLGEIRVAEQVIGYAALAQATVGFQIGKQLFHELVVFTTPQALESFKLGQVSFAANASAAVVSSGAAKTVSRSGTRVFVQPMSGFGVEAGIGGQKFFFIPAALGRVRSAFEPAKSALKANLKHFGKSTNPNVPPRGGPQVPIGHTIKRGTKGLGREKGHE